MKPRFSNRLTTNICNRSIRSILMDTGANVRNGLKADIAASSVLLQLHWFMEPSFLRTIRALVLATALVPASTPALACECSAPALQSAADREQQAEWIASTNASIAEVELVHFQRGDRYRTVRPLWGEPQASYPVRDPLRPVTSCDYEMAPGKRAIMVFLPQSTDSKVGRSAQCGRSSRSSSREFYPAGMCIQFFVQAPGNLERVRRRAAR